MKVALIACTYGLNNTGGAAIAATRLHLALLKAGFDSHFICMSQCEAGPNVHALKVQHLFRRRMVKLVYNVMLNIIRVLRTRKLRLEKFELPPHSVGVYDVLGMIRQINPDVVHIHWINADGWSWWQLKQIKCPVVFHMHDMYPFTTAFGYTWNDKRYITGYDRSNSTWLERYDARMKSGLLNTLRPIMVGPSHWICSECEKSVIGHGLKTMPIPNIMDDAITYNPSKYPPHENYILLFGCNLGTQNQYKGWADLVGALKLVSDDVKSKMEVHVFGEKAESRIESGVRIVFLGELKSSRELCAAYNESDAFVMPSRQDNAPSVKFEALMCGLPVLAFDRQGCAEGIEPKINGWVSPDGDVKDYARGIEYFYGLYRAGKLGIMRTQIATKAAQIYATDKILAQFMSLYRQRVEGIRE